MKNKLINIPNNTQLFKIGSFNVNLVDSVDYKEKIDIIANYIFSHFYETELDIICLQGITETKLAKALVNVINNMSIKTKNPIHIIPTKIVNDSLVKFSSSLEVTWNSDSGCTNSEELDTEIIHNIIISRYPIISTYCISLNEQDNKSQHTDGKNMVMANININGYLI